METVIKIRKISKVYPANIRALSHLTLNVPRGIFGLLGPNGSGKTTLIQILTGVIRPSCGSVQILGYDLKKEMQLIKKNLGYLPEHPGLYEDMRGLKFLQYMGRLSGLSKKEAQDNAKRLLKEVDLQKWESTKIRRYSAGMKQRIAFAQSLLNNPQIIFLDEPTKGLDPLERQKVLNKIKKIKEQGKTVFLSSHILVEIEKVAGCIAIISNGKLLFQGMIEEIKKKGGLSSVYRKVLIG
ncbi:MAG TPA: ABC transporter ATP-binding protein [bacterium]|nr:ABC transporter ATP-binding protein [bacterium]